MSTIVCLFDLVAIVLSVILRLTAMDYCFLYLQILHDNQAHGEVYSIQHYVMFISNLRQVGGILHQ